MKQIRPYFEAVQKFLGAQKSDGLAEKTKLDSENFNGAIYTAKSDCATLKFVVESNMHHLIGIDVTKLYGHLRTADATHVPQGMQVITVNDYIVPQEQELKN